MNNRANSHTRLVILIAFAAYTCGARAASATCPLFQDWTLEIALGGGSTHVAGAGTKGGMSGRIGAVRMFGDHWAAGVSMAGTTREELVTDSTHVDSFYMNRAVSVRWLPFGMKEKRAVLDLRAGIGAGFVEVEETIEPTQRLEMTDNGVGLFVGAGYLLSLGSEVSVGLEMEVTWLRDISVPVRFLASNLVVAWHL